jgi:hypothetical protein
MTIAQLSNILVMILCSAVLVQSVRLMRAFQAMKRGTLVDTVGALDRATGEAQHVLGELKRALEACRDHQDSLARGRTLLDELEVIVGIADGTAERLAQVASLTTQLCAMAAERGDGEAQPEMGQEAA